MAEPDKKRENTNKSTSADKKGSKKRDKKKEDAAAWLVLVAFLFTVTLVLIFLAWAIASARLLFVELLIAAAAMIVGGLLGFLFGMPRAGSPVETGDDLAGSTVTYRPSNNLELVSDWLTKLLIGVGLVEIKQLSGVLKAIGGAVENSFNGAPDRTNAITQAVVVTFVVFGFLCSFLWTRIYYGRLQALADSEIVRALRRALGETQNELVIEKAEKKEAVAEKNEAFTAAKQMITGEIPVPATPKPSAATRVQDSAPAKELKWPPDIQEKLDKFESAPVDWDDETAWELFKERQPPLEQNGRRFEAEIALDLRGALIIILRVRRLSGDRLIDPVAFLLHPTFTQRVVYSEPIGNIAETRISPAGAFTAIAIADGGKTILAYDLSTLPNAPAWFKNN
jgi:hypothetical protein